VFLRNESAYDRVAATNALGIGDYPTVFEHSRAASSQRYFAMLTEALGPKPMKPVYDRFLTALRRIEEASVLTTNVDEALERSLPEFTLLQHSDLSRALPFVTSGKRFIGKLHGSISLVQSAVFTTGDYKRLVCDGTFIHVLQTLLTTCCIVFVGYGLRDRYLFELLRRNADLLSLFGDGPHFLVSAEDRQELPATVNVIRYRTELHKDHRSSILALELLSRPSEETEALWHGRTERSPMGASAPPSLRSAHFVSDLYPGGTWTTGQVLGLNREDGTKAELIVGPDWSVEELPNTSATAAFDMAVGLTCFDRVLLPIECVGRLHQVLGSDLFWHLVFADIIEFVQWEGIDGVMASDPLSPFGHLVTGKVPSQEPLSLVTRQLSPVPGREQEAAGRFAQLVNKVVRVDLSGTLNFADVCNGLLLSPETRRTLGLSDATPMGHIPRWAAAPAIRLIQIARVGATCQKLGLSSMKLMAGASQVAQVAFSALAGGILAEEAAAYALTGQFGVIPEEVFGKNPQIWASILAFRDTNEGTNLRSYVTKYLEANQGAEIAASIDASLRQALPYSLLDQSRSRMSALLLATRLGLPVTPGIWSDASRIWNGPVAWRARARGRLEAYLLKHAIGPYDLCPCGSFEKVKFCCLDALQQP
jgi:hypothetical protein